MSAAYRITVLVFLLLVPGRDALGQESAGAVSPEIYEGWRQYSVHCARCHGQDVVGNPVAANLLKSAGDGGPVAEEGAFTRVVLDGRTDRGMPAFKGQVTPEQSAAMHAYVRARATGQVPVGRPKPAG
ncbi:MAG TPA: cytochrome c [Gemmatimonadales bacterium]|nr:cytochrome c [Gemmatimonadales bacterium]